MTRQAGDWLLSYVRYANVTEAPRRFHFWAGVSAVAAALRRKVWIDMRRYTWVCNMYIVFVAPPGVIAKSTTAGIAERLMKQVPLIKFGANSVTWQRMVEALSECGEGFIHAGEEHAMSPLTFVSSELGSLINMQDRDMVTALTDLWDGKDGHTKETKGSGNDQITRPWVNILGCTTPGWIADNMPSSTIGGGFTSRCIFLYAEEKERYIPFVDEMVDIETDRVAEAQLVTDLNHMAENLSGPVGISPAARDWFRPIYEAYWKAAKERMDDKLASGYVARKQTHLFKLATILSVSRGDSLMIEKEDLELAEVMLREVESEMGKVFSKIGRSAISLNAETLLNLIVGKGHSGIPYADAYKIVYHAFPNAQEFSDILTGLLRSGQVVMAPGDGGMVLKAPTNGHGNIGG